MAQALGISPRTLLSWERRYGVVTPRRTAGGHRRYTENDLDRLRVFAQVTRRRQAKKAAKIVEEMDRAEQFDAAVQQRTSQGQVERGIEEQ